jgi:hypothetical protein
VGLVLSTGILCTGLIALTALVGATPAFADVGAPGTFTISASTSSIALGDRAFVSVHRTGGTDGVVSVSVDSAALPVELASVIAPIDTEVVFLDNDAADKTIPIVFLGDDQPGGLPGDGDLLNDVPGDVGSGGVVPGDIVSGGVVPGGVVPGDVVPGGAVPGDIVSGGVVPGVDGIQDETDWSGGNTPHIVGTGGNAARAATSAVAPEAVSQALAATDSGTAPLIVSLSAPTGGAALGTPSSVSISVVTPPTTTPADDGSGTTGSTTGGTTTPGASPKNSSKTTSPVGGGQSLADTGVDAVLPFIVATLAAIVGLAVLLLVRRHPAS